MRKIFTFLLTLLMLEGAAQASNKESFDIDNFPSKKEGEIAFRENYKSLSILREEISNIKSVDDKKLFLNNLATEDFQKKFKETLKSLKDSMSDYHIRKTQLAFKLALERSIMFNMKEGEICPYTLSSLYTVCKLIGGAGADKIVEISNDVFPKDN